MNSQYSIVILWPLTSTSSRFWHKLVHKFYFMLPYVCNSHQIIGLLTCAIHCRVKASHGIECCWRYFNLLSQSLSGALRSCTIKSLLFHLLDGFSLWMLSQLYCNVCVHINGISLTRTPVLPIEGQVHVWIYECWTVFPKLIHPLGVDASCFVHVNLCEAIYSPVLLTVRESRLSFN